MSDQLYLQLWIKGMILVSNNMQYFTVKLLRIMVEKSHKLGCYQQIRKQLNGGQIYVCSTEL